MLKENIKVTTTTGFENSKIIQYLEPVTAHVVIGMNVFSDIASSFTDFFGGQSSSYEKKLSSMNMQAIELLKKKAYKMGGNCIIGLKVDNDEISAQNKSMLMVSVVGTVAIGEFNKSESNNLDIKKTGTVSNEQLDILIERKELIELADLKKLKLDTYTWDFIKKNRVIDLYEYCLNSLIDYVGGSTYYADGVISRQKHLKELNTLLDTDYISNCLYNLLKSEISSNARLHIYEVIKESNLINYEQISQLIDSDSFEVQRYGVNLSSNSKLEYNYEDIEKIKTIIKGLSNNFKERGVKSTKKKAFVSKEIEIWNCECGKENSIHDSLCIKCGYDIYGFKKGTMNHLEVIEYLNDKIDILETSFS